MPLPTMNTPTFKVKLHSLSSEVEFRPFLVKEEKILILAQESNDPKEMIKAMQDIVTTCSTGAIDGKDLPFFDLQNAFIRLRSQSIGSMTDFILICGECGHKTETTLDLDTLTVEHQDNHTNKIMLSDNVGVFMKYPKAEILVDDETPAFDLVVSCVDKIFDQDEIYSAEDEGKEEVEKFVNSLSTQQFEKIVEFFQTSPRLEKTIDYACAKCGTENTVLIDGVENFFE
jgi:DNA-directed RNA polymerase subunit RPC12/RpoP